jgi:hypothetical protein
MKLDDINEALAAVRTLRPAPLDPRLLQGLDHAEQVLKEVQRAAMIAQQEKLAGRLNSSLREQLLEDLWDSLVDPA